MAKATHEEYIRWVKGSLNRILGATMADNGSDDATYRSWIVAFQTNQGLATHGKVDIPTQDELIQRGRYIPEYVKWLRAAMIAEGGIGIAAEGPYDEIRPAIKEFQISEDPPLKDDGWVGPDTETAIISRHSFPPGRKRTPVKPVDPPKPVGPSIFDDPEWKKMIARDTIDLWAGSWLREIEDGSYSMPDSTQKRKMKCILKKMRSSSIYNWEYIPHDRAISYMNGGSWWKSASTADDLTSDLMEQLMAKLKWWKSKSKADQYAAFQTEMMQSYYAIEKALVAIQTQLSDESGVVAPGRNSHSDIRQWVRHRQERSRYMISCFETKF